MVPRATTAVVVGTKGTCVAPAAARGTSTDRVNITRKDWLDRLGTLGRPADIASMGAYITVSDAAGRILYRRPATDDEIRSALGAAQVAEREAQAAMDRIAHERAERDGHDWADSRA